MHNVDELDQIWRDGLSLAAAAMTDVTDPVNRVAVRVRHRRRARTAITATSGVVIVLLIVAGVAFGRGLQDDSRFATSRPVTDVTVVAGPALRIRFPDRVVSGQPPRVELPPGEIRFTIRTVAGSHHLVIDGIPRFVAAGSPSKTVSVVVRIAPGRYRMHCTIPGHSEAGEEAILIVR